MRVLIFTSTGGTAHDAAAYALRDWLRLWDPAVEVQVEHVLENASPVTRAGVDLYNWIQRHGPWLHQIYWRLVEFEDLIKPGTLLFGRTYVIRLLRRFRPDVLVSTHPHINRGHFDLAKRVLGRQLRCITSCTELDGGFGFSRNWVTRTADGFWAITPEVAQEVRGRGYPAERVQVLGPLLYPLDQQTGLDAPSVGPTLPLLVLGSGANGANNHVQLLKALLPLAGRLRVVALCGRREAAVQEVRAWAQRHPDLAVEALGFQDPQAMAALYRQAWAMVARPGARTATEALVFGCVLIFNTFGAPMPQELLALRYFRERGLHLSMRSPADLQRQLRDWLDHPATHRRLVARYRATPLCQSPDAVRQFLQPAGSEAAPA